MPQDTLELGKLLVSEILDHGNVDTLTVWLAHYIAELITNAEKEGPSLNGRAAKKEACETILKLWEHRATLAGRANPMKEYENAVQMLHKLSNEGYFVFGGMNENAEPVEQLRRSALTLLSSLFVLTLPDSGEKDDVAVHNLSKIERRFMRELNVIKIRRMVTKGEIEAAENPLETLKRDIIEDISRVRASLDAIEDMLSNE